MAEGGQRKEVVDKGKAGRLLLSTTTAFIYFTVIDKVGDVMWGVEDYRGVKRRGPGEWEEDEGGGV